MKYDFQNTEELLNLCKKYKLPISQIAVRREMELFIQTRPQIRNKMKQIRETMWEAIQRGIKSASKSQYGLSGGDAKKMHEGLKKMGKLFHSKVAIRAMAYAIATNEENANMGRIVAFPTAGGSGVIPGVLFSAFHHIKSGKRKMLNALFTASAIGVAILERGGTISAAKGGCQAEVGVATAMATAGLTEMRGGTPEQCINAAALALKNTIGLACDPIGGLVEVPCVKRNAIFVNVAIGASDMSILGVKSYVPMDEIIDAMNNVTDGMWEGIRETALGGLAVTRTGIKVREKMGLKPIPKKYRMKGCEGCRGCK